MNYNLNEEDKNYLNKYSIDNFSRPSLTTDLVVFSVSKPKYIKKSVEKGKLKVLLVKRDHSPFKGLYALPGGFCVPDEDVDVTAKRLLKEETNAFISNIEISGVYGSCNRDPRGWIISNSFLCLTEINKVDLRIDKWETKWFDVDLNIKDNRYYMTLTNNELVFNNTLELIDNKFKIIQSDISFDHACIILDNLIKLSKKVLDNYKLAFDVLESEFTLFEFQDACEKLTLRQFITSNFRRDIKNIVVETNKTKTLGQFRPSKLYKRTEG